MTGNEIDEFLDAFANLDAQERALVFSELRLVYCLTCGARKNVRPCRCKERP